MDSSFIVNVVIFGGGNQAQYVIDILERAGMYSIVGIIDSVKPVGSIVYGYPVIGRQEDIADLLEFLPDKIDGGVIAIGDNFSREKVYKAIIDKVPTFKFINAIHPSCVIADNVVMGYGVVAMAGCIFNPGARVGSHTFFATGAQIEHDCTIADFASVSAGSVFGGHVKLGKYSAVTLGCTVFDRVTIGENSVIGSGSLVTKNIPDNCLYYGSPARYIRSRKLGDKWLK